MVIKPIGCAHSNALLATSLIRQLGCVYKFAHPSLNSTLSLHYQLATVSLLAQMAYTPITSLAVARAAVHSDYIQTIQPCAAKLNALLICIDTGRT